MDKPFKWITCGNICICRQMKNKCCFFLKNKKETFTQISHTYSLPTELPKFKTSVSTQYNTGWIIGENTAMKITMAHAFYLYIQKVQCYMIFARLFFLRIFFKLDKNNGTTDLTIICNLNIVKNYAILLIVDFILAQLVLTDLPIIK